MGDAARPRDRGDTLPREQPDEADQRRCRVVFVRDIDDLGDIEDPTLCERGIGDDGDVPLATALIEVVLREQQVHLDLVRRHRDID